MDENQRAIHGLIGQADEAANCLDELTARLRVDRVLETMQVSSMAEMIKMAEHIEAAGKALGKRLESVSRGEYVAEPRSFLTRAS